MSIISLVATLVVMIWLILTMFAQFRVMSEKFSRFDSLRLIPIWTFFAPNPGIVDYHIVIRDRCKDGSLTPWRGIDIAADRHPLNFIWNPQKRPKKILIDTVQSLMLTVKYNSQSAGHEIISLPYLMLLNLATSAPDLYQDSLGRQFAVVQSSGHVEKDMQLAYMSHFHKIFS